MKGWLGFADERVESVWRSRWIVVPLVLFSGLIYYGYGKLYELELARWCDTSDEPDWWNFCLPSSKRTRSASQTRSDCHARGDRCEQQLSQLKEYRFNVVRTVKDHRKWNPGRHCAPGSIRPVRDEHRDYCRGEDSFVVGGRGYHPHLNPAREPDAQGVFWDLPGECARGGMCRWFLRDNETKKPTDIWCSCTWTSGEVVAVH